MLREYVSDGGVLIADIRPAIYDGHVKPLAAGQLDDVFGIERTGFGPAAVAEGQIEVPSADRGRKLLDVPAARADGGVQAAGASAAGSAGEAPLMLTNQFGQGRAVLLNMAMSSFPSRPDTEAAAELAGRLFLQTLGDVAPAVALTTPQGRHLRNVEITRWMNGPVQIVSIFSHAREASRATVTLPDARYVYDLKRGEDLGRTSAFTVKLTPSRAQFFALSAAPVEPVGLRPGAEAVAPGEVQRVEVASAMRAGQQAVKVQVTLPDGSAADWIDPVVITDRRGATVDVPVALNDPTGTWTVSATELYTGDTTTAQFGVR